MKKTKFSLNAEIEKIIKKFNLSNEWNKSVLRETKEYKNNKFKKKSFKRKNLKNLDFVTID